MGQMRMINVQNKGILNVQSTDMEESSYKKIYVDW